MINVVGLSVSAKDITDVAEKSRPLPAKVCYWLNEDVLVLSLYIAYENIPLDFITLHHYLYASSITTTYFLMSFPIVCKI